MRFVIQRVNRASVSAEGRVLGRIGKGFMVLAGICETDTKETADKMIAKMAKLRIFDDENGKTNLDINTVGGSLLIVSQFTLYADCRKGNRPSFIKAGDPKRAEELYEYILEKAQEFVPDVQRGEFGAHMKIDLENDGPFTVILDSAELLRK
ncbi:MAG: D-tyrosyl-tRNA(Tyr) deacylase [Lachnospiraceae bacterium]|nr:D-tyrosyl-tRNA(Tyr) deacylase [Lachnospiraceae bacterium]